MRTAAKGGSGGGAQRQAPAGTISCTRRDGWWTAPHEEPAEPRYGVRVNCTARRGPLRRSLASAGRAAGGVTRRCARGRSKGSSGVGRRPWRNPSRRRCRGPSRRRAACPESCRRGTRCAPWPAGAPAKFGGVLMRQTCASTVVERGAAPSGTSSAASWLSASAARAGRWQFLTEGRSARLVEQRSRRKWSASPSRRTGTWGGIPVRWCRPSPDLVDSVAVPEGVGARPPGRRSDGTPTPCTRTDAAVPVRRATSGLRRPRGRCGESSQ